MSEKSNVTGLLALPDEVLEHVTSHLCAPGQLLTVTLTCKKLQMVSEGFARRFVDSEATDEERDNLPRVDLPTMGAEAGELVGRKWGVIARYHLILKHREVLQFDQIVGDVQHAEGDKSEIVRLRPVSVRSLASGFGSSNRIMRSGVHKANFELSCPRRVNGVWIGIARPMDYYNKSLYEYPDYADPTDTGIEARYPHAWHDESKVNSVLWDIHYKRAQIRKWQREVEILNLYARFYNADKVGFLLDLDNGTLSFFKNGARIGGVVSGLVGEYVWVVNLFDIVAGDQTLSIRISEWD